MNLTLQNEFLPLFLKSSITRKIDVFGCKDLIFSKIFKDFQNAGPSIPSFPSLNFSRVPSVVSVKPQVSQEHHGARDLHAHKSHKVPHLQPQKDSCS